MTAIVASATSCEYIVSENDEICVNKAVHHLSKCIASQATYVPTKEQSSNYGSTPMDCMDRWSVEWVSDAPNMDRARTYDFISANDAALE